MPDIYISIGSNIDREKNIKRALGLLVSTFSNIKCSNVYESDAVGFDGDHFYNLVVQISTNESLESVLDNLKNIEAKCGRENGSTEKKFGPRTIDLDLLLYGDKVLHNQNVDLPRTDITRYDFVLLPLSELAPDMPHPELKTSFEKLWEQFSNKEGNLKQVSFSSGQ